MIGVDIEEARAEVRRAANRAGASQRPDQRRRPRAAHQAPRRRASSCPTCATRASRSSARRSSWSSSTRRRSAAPTTDVGANDFTHPTYRAVWELVAAAGGPAAGAGDAGLGGPAARRGHRPGRRRRRSARSAVEPLLTRGARRGLRRRRTCYRLQELTAMRRIAELKSRLQRTNPVEHADRVQPDVRRARRPRAAPPRRCASSAVGRPVRRRSEARAVAVGVGGRRCWPGPQPRPARGRSPAPATRSTVAAGTSARGAVGPVGAGRGGRLGPRHLERSGSARSGRGASSGSSTTVHARRAARLLLELVRERVTASVVLQRHVPVAGRRGRPGDRPPRAARRPAGDLGLRVRRGRRPRRPGGPAGRRRRRSRPPATRSAGLLG